MGFEVKEASSARVSFNVRNVSASCGGHIHPRNLVRLSRGDAATDNGAADFNELPVKIDGAPL